MKATINGITVEGTPQEIMDFQRLQNEKMGIKPYTPNNPTTSNNPTTDYQWMLLKPQINSIGSATSSKCPNYGSACYCTGACKI